MGHCCGNIPVRNGDDDAFIGEDFIEIVGAYGGSVIGEVLGEEMEILANRSLCHA